MAIHNKPLAGDKMDVQKIKKDFETLKGKRYKTRFGAGQLTQVYDNCDLGIFVYDDGVEYEVKVGNIATLKFEGDGKQPAVIYLKEIIGDG